MSIKCPFCERVVIARVNETSGKDPRTTIVMYYHDNGDMHFRVNKPKDDLPEAELTGTV